MTRRATRADAPLLARLRREHGLSDAPAEQIADEIIDSPHWVVMTDGDRVCAMYVSRRNRHVRLVYLLPESADLEPLFRLALATFRQVAQEHPEAAEWPWEPVFDGTPREKLTKARVWREHAKLLNSWDNADKRVLGLVRHAADYAEAEL